MGKMQLLTCAFLALSPSLVSALTVINYTNDCSFASDSSSPYRTYSHCTFGVVLWINKTSLVKINGKFSVLTHCLGEVACFAQRIEGGSDLSNLTTATARSSDRHRTNRHASLRRHINKWYSDWSSLLNYGRLYVNIIFKITYVTFKIFKALNSKLRVNLYVMGKTIENSTSGKSLPARFKADFNFFAMTFH